MRPRNPDLDDYREYLSLLSLNASTIRVYVTQVRRILRDVPVATRDTLTEYFYSTLDSHTRASTRVAWRHYVDFSREVVGAVLEEPLLLPRARAKQVKELENELATVKRSTTTSSVASSDDGAGREDTESLKLQVRSLTFQLQELQGAVDTPREVPREGPAGGAPECALGPLPRLPGPARALARTVRAPPPAAPGSRRDFGGLFRGLRGHLREQKRSGGCGLQWMLEVVIRRPGSS